MTYKYINNYTGEVYTSVVQAISHIVNDIIYFPGCRTIKILNIGRIKED